jgi:hypothetical protein
MHHHKCSMQPTTSGVRLMQQVLRAHRLAPHRRELGVIGACSDPTAAFCPYSKMYRHRAACAPQAHSVHTVRCIATEPCAHAHTVDQPIHLNRFSRCRWRTWTAERHSALSIEGTKRMAACCVSCEWALARSRSKVCAGARHMSRCMPKT